MWCERQKKKNPTRAHQNSCEHCDDVMCVVQRSGFGAPKEFASKERRWLSGPAKALRNDERKRERRGRPIKALRFIVARRSLCFYVALCSSLRRLGALRWPAGTMVFLRWSNRFSPHPHTHFHRDRILFLVVLLREDCALFCFSSLRETMRRYIWII